MGKNITYAVPEIVLGMPQISEGMSRGSPNFRVADKTFAISQIKHLDNGRVKLWLQSPPGEKLST